MEMKAMHTTSSSSSYIVHKVEETVDDDDKTESSSGFLDIKCRLNVIFMPSPNKRKSQPAREVGSLILLKKTQYPANRVLM